MTSAGADSPVSETLRPRLGAGAEFDAIRDLLGTPAPELPGPVTVGPGDDAAVLAQESEDVSLLLTVDRIAEGVHFRREWLAPEAVGWRAAVASLSDLAAMAGAPVGLLVSLGVPGGSGELATLRRIGAGLREAAQVFAAPLLGGDLTRSPQGVVVDVTAVGRACQPVTRTGGRPGDHLWVTGRLGGSGAAVAAWEAGRRPPDAARERFTRPLPRLEEAAWLAEQGALRALLDLSDGLAGDAGHLAAASDLAVLLNEDAIPVDPAARDVTETPENALRLALSGGEDFELAFLAPPGRVEELREPFRRRFGLELTCVGEGVEGEGVWMRPNAGGDAVRLERGGHDHFREGDG